MAERRPLVIVDGETKELPSGDSLPGAAPGEDGTDGATWILGSIPPNDIQGADGDFYLDASSGLVYGPKASGTWGESVGSLKGATGDEGEQGEAGSLFDVYAGSPDGVVTSLSSDHKIIDNSTGNIWQTTGLGTTGWAVTVDYQDLFSGGGGADGDGLTLGAVQGSDFTAEANHAYPIDLTANNVTVTMPSSPANGDRVRYFIAVAALPNYATDSPFGNIQLESIGDSVTYEFVSETSTWNRIGDSGVTGNLATIRFGSGNPNSSIFGVGGDFYLDYTTLEWWTSSTGGFDTWYKLSTAPFKRPVYGVSATPLEMSDYGSSAYGIALPKPADNVSRFVLANTGMHPEFNTIGDDIDGAFEDGAEVTIMSTLSGLSITTAGNLKLPFATTIVTGSDWLAKFQRVGSSWYCVFYSDYSGV